MKSKKLAVILSIIFFMLAIVLAFLAFGPGCFFTSKVYNIKNPSNINVEIMTGYCLERFEIFNKEPSLKIIKIIGDIKKDGKLLKNQEVCQGDYAKDGSFIRSHSIKLGNNISCSPITLNNNQEFNIQFVQNSFEIITDKGNITGNVKYTNSSDILIYASLVFLVLAILLIIIYFILRKK